MIDVSVVIPTYNDDDTLDKCLQSILDQSYPADQYEVVIVDGHSDDRTVAIAEEYDCRIFFEDKGTISFARELGTEKANGKYIAFTDADCVVERDWLKKLRATIDMDTDVAGVGGPNITPEDDSPLAKSVGDFFELFSKVGARYGYSNDTTTEVEHNPTCNVLYRKEVVQEVGGFNEQLVTVDDEEMDYRIRQQGYKLLFRPDAVVKHYRRPTWRRFSSMAHSYGYGRGQAIRLHRELGKWFHFAPTITAVIIITLFACTLFTTLPLLVPILLVLFGEVLVLSAAVHLRQQNDGNLTTYIGIINIWLTLWSVGFAKGLLDPPSPYNK